MQLTKLLSTLISIISLSEAYRILVVFPICAKSHNILGNGVVNNLLKAGHEVVHITCIPNKKTITNLTEIDVSAMDTNDVETKEVDSFKLKNLVGKDNIADSLQFFYMIHELTKKFLKDESLTEFFLNTTQQFDVVIAEWMFTDLAAGIAPLYKCPLIWVSTMEAHWQILRLIDGPSHPAYSVDIFSTNNLPLTFVERVTELWVMIKKMVFINLIVTYFEKNVYNEVFLPIAAKRGVTMPSYQDAVYNGSFLLLNSHPSYGTPFQLPQNAKYVGGYHIDTNVHPLPKDIQKIMDEARDGVIYFSMGSNLKSMDMSDNMKRSILKTFSELKQTVLWKFEGNLSDVPANVHLMKWAPQQSILAHPNIKMFINHGGQLSTTEAIHCGVPVIGIPVFGDQYINIKSAVHKGFGIMVRLTEDIAGHLAEAIREILQNESYKNKAVELSKIYHNRPLPPGKELVYWVEEVIQTGGAAHLRSPALHVPLYQKAYLDLIALVSIIIYLLRKIMSKLLSFRRKTEVKANKKKIKKH
ncbi:hypothetical protein ACJJTC_014657 [Scirpophaga incertulas]